MAGLGESKSLRRQISCDCKCKLKVESSEVSM